MKPPASDEFDAWSLGWSVASSAIGGVIVGALIDWATGLAPWFTLGFGAAGIISGFYHLLRGAARLNRATRPPRRPGGPPSVDGRPEALAREKDDSAESPRR